MNTTITGLLAITVTGLIATTPRSLTTSDTETVTSFRFVALNPNVDQLSGQSEDPRWYTVTATGVLARNAAASLRKGDRVIVTGIVTTRYRDDDGEGVTGATNELAAASIGHDLCWGTTVYTRHTTPVLVESAAQH